MKSVMPQAVSWLGFELAVAQQKAHATDVMEAVRRGAVRTA